MKRCFLTLAMILAVVILASCSEKAKNPVGFGLVEEEGPWKTSQLIIQELLSDSCIAVTTGAGGGYYLLAGTWEEQEIRSLMLFEDLPDTLNLTLAAVSLNLTAFSEASEESLLISVHPLTTDWDDSTVTWEMPWSQPGGDFVAEPIAEEFYAIETSSQLELVFDSTGVELVRDWLNGGPNNGLLIKAAESETDNMKYFYSENNIYDPMLTFTFLATDTTDTTIVSAECGQDAFIVQPQDSPAEDFLCVRDGILWRTWLHFKIPAIPESVFVNHASLSLTINEFSSPRDQMYVGVYRVTDTATLEFNPSLVGYANLHEDKDLVQIDVTSLAQEWANGIQNAGLILRPYPEYSELAEALFYTSMADSSQRPTLTITYTARPGDNLTATAHGEKTP